MMLVLVGPQAFSPFRLQNVLTQMQLVEPAVRDVTATYFYLVDLKHDLTDRELFCLQALLQVDAADIADGSEVESVWLVPRIGTVSPWASKATEIAQRCGLEAVQRIERVIRYDINAQDPLHLTGAESKLRDVLSDRMTQNLIVREELERVFRYSEPSPIQTIPVMQDGIAALQAVNEKGGLGLSEQEIDYLYASYQQLQRDPTDAELVMFAQVNSEHCRHKIFNAAWSVDGEQQGLSLFEMIRHTTNQHPDGVLSAYHDNAAVIEGALSENFTRDSVTQSYAYRKAHSHIVMKVETHNHPTAISPYPGAATGVGGEIRDEGATGRGSYSKAGLTGFTVSHLRIPGYLQSWENGDIGKPEHMANALHIMLEAPIGGAAFGNEFGRPNLTGYFRTFEQTGLLAEAGQRHGYLKPIMLAGGVGSIRAEQIEKKKIVEQACVIVLGGSAMLIGLGGGAASSRATGQAASELDFASVQRENPEMQRRCQEVINACWAFGVDNPILSLHDVGAGGLCNAVPELVHDGGRSGWFQLRDVPCDDPGMSPMEIWCNESQERFVLAIMSQHLPLFEQLCERERCPFAVIGKATADERLVVEDSLFDNQPVNLPIPILFGKTPRMQRTARRRQSQQFKLQDTALTSIDLADAAHGVLRFPAVADKSFLITIADRSVTGLVCRDQMVGPWQVPVADVAVTAAGFKSYAGEAMALGERSPIAVYDAAASGRMAIAEAITNVAAADITQLGDIKLSANWMAAAGFEHEDAALFDTVKAVGLELCPALGIAIPVGKDSLSMQTTWFEKEQKNTVVSPVSLVATAYASVADVRKTLTPELLGLERDTVLLLIDLGQGKNRLGASVFAQTQQLNISEVPDLDMPELLMRYFSAIQALRQQGLLLAYHDRSDGGLLATVCEMAFAARCGLEIELASCGADALSVLFAEELGAVIQVERSNLIAVKQCLLEHQLDHCSHQIGHPVARSGVRHSIEITWQGRPVFAESRSTLQRSWSETSYRLQMLRDNPVAVQQQYDAILDDADGGLHALLSFDFSDDICANLTGLNRPQVAILREQGVNGHIEMAAAFERSGFDVVDVHMSDLLAGRRNLAEFSGLVACGGFSYGDVLGAGGGWAKSILYNPVLKEMFLRFFEDPAHFGLGVCNGCQMFSQLRELIPGTEHWPMFKRNESEQFEARVSLVEIQPTPSIFFQGMAGSRIPVAVAHGEGRAEWGADADQQDDLIALRFIDHAGVATERYPANPNGSPHGITGLCNTDGRFTIMMPHPERCFRTIQNSWHPEGWGEDAPWLRMFRNARVWIG